MTKRYTATIQVRIEADSDVDAVRQMELIVRQMKRQSMVEDAECPTSSVVPEDDENL